MKVFYFGFTPVYLILEGFVLPYMVGFGGYVGKLCSWLHFFPFDFGYNSGIIAWCSLFLNYFLWWFIAYSFIKIYKKRQKIKNETEIIDSYDSK